ncbi:MAG: hypothetical protein A3E83_05050 [Gammaproteobacteria bacterium RIFCSPHIGHO2_12_FULL_41_20]|nr:MAG: hypothetical protein A3E83_05050 [Gammaproteobacteria bacterium RIFCSPHIGHO2_12_FULL_41_20]
MFAQPKLLAVFSKKHTGTDNIQALQQELYHTDLDFHSLTDKSIQEYLSRIKRLYIATYDVIAELQPHPENIKFSTVIQPLIDLRIFVETAYQLCVFPMHVHPIESVRKASAETSKELGNLIVTCEQRQDVFQVLRKYEATTYQQEKSSLSTEQNRYVIQLMQEYKRNGLYIQDEKTKEEITSIKKRISELCIEFQHNYNEAKTSFIMTTEELAGVPECWFSKDRQVSPNHYRVTLQRPDIFTLLDYAKNREVRKKIYVAFHSICEKENLPVLKEALLLRQKLAKLLGYETYADYVTETRIAKTGHNVRIFLETMNEQFTPLLKNNLQALTYFARSIEHDDSFILQYYDLRYYMRLREEALLNINSEKIKTYFSREKVIQGTLDIYEKLFGVQFVKQEHKKTWHNDVKTFDVYNYDHAQHRQGEKIGSFYLDLHPRDGKYNHAEAYGIIHGCDLSHLEQSNQRRLSIVAMVCNFPKHGYWPLEDVITFFHEFGHVMHFICSHTALAAFHGENVEMDFLEAPSQMLENWCYEPGVLRLLSAHPDTHEPLPETVAMQLKEQFRMHAGYVYRQALMLSLFDYWVHTMSIEELTSLDVKTFFHHLQRENLQLPIIDETCDPASFTHLLSEYGGNYYGYLMSEAYAADMYDTVFKRDPLSTVNGEKYRRYILQPGASQNGMELMRNFLGRVPTVNAFLRKCGLPSPVSHRKKTGNLFNTEQVSREQPAPAELDKKSSTVSI